LLEVRSSGIVIVGFAPQLEPTTAEHVKLIVYIDACPVGAAGGGGLSAVIAICAADAASATLVSSAPEPTLATSEPNRRVSTTRHPRSLRPYDPPALSDPWTGRGDRSRIGRDVMRLVRAIACGLMRVPVSWKSLVWSYGPHARFRGLSKACGNPAASACPHVAADVPLRG
jgi:hypothetical protein